MCLNIQGDCFLFSSLTEIVAILVTESPRLKWILGDELKSNRTYPRKEKKDQSLVASHRHLTELLTLPSLATLVYWHLSPNKRNFQIVDNIRVGNADYSNGMHSITKHTRFPLACDVTHIWRQTFAGTWLWVSKIAHFAICGEQM